MVDHSDTMHGPARMWLVIVAGGRPERAVEVTGMKFVVGRGEDCDLVLDDPKVSRQHAAIVPGGPGRHVLYDLDSANGTLVNGHLVAAPMGFSKGRDKMAELWGDERLQFGDTTVVTTTQDPGAVVGHALDQEASGHVAGTDPSNTQP